MKRVMFPLVMVIGRLAAICSRKSGMTDPREAMTLP
jgi:hypothetical protein